MIEKHGEVTTESHSDFDPTKKAVYFDEDGTEIADEGNKHKLRKAIKIAQEIEPE